MAAYATLGDVKALVPGTTGTVVTWNAQDDVALSTLTVQLSRMFDRSTSKPDNWYVGITGSSGTANVPPDVNLAVAAWTVYVWQRGRGGFSDVSAPVGQGAVNQIRALGVPPETQRAIDYWTTTYAQPVAGEIGSTLVAGVVKVPPIIDVRFPGFRSR